MTLDTVIAGCMAYYLDSPDGLDPQRQAILENCVNDLSELLPEIPDEARPYFGQLQALATLLCRSAPG